RPALSPNRCCLPTAGRVHCTIGCWTARVRSLPKSCSRIPIAFAFDSATPSISARRSSASGLIGNMPPPAIRMWENCSLVDESLSHLSCALSEGRRTGFYNAGAEVRLQLALASALMYAHGLAPEADAAWDLALTLADQGGDV